MSSDTNIPDLETLLHKGIERRPVNVFFIRRNYTNRELKTLRSLEPDASKAVGRQLSDRERNVLLEYEGSAIASTSAFAASMAAMGGLLSTIFMTRVRRRQFCGQIVHRLQVRRLSLRDFGGITFLVFQTALLLDPIESQPLSLKVLSDPRMSEFKKSIQHRRKEFGGHEPEIVRRTNKNIEEPIQWFKAASRSKYIASIKVLPPREIDLEESLPITGYPDHPDLTWPEGSSSYRNKLRDNLIVGENQISEGLGWQEVLEFLECCNRTEPLHTFVYNPPALIPRLYVE